MLLRAAPLCAARCIFSGAKESRIFVTFCTYILGARNTMVWLFDNICFQMADLDGDKFRGKEVVFVSFYILKISSS